MNTSMKTLQKTSTKFYLTQKMKKEQQLTNTIIYQGKNGAIEFKGDFDQETIWANLDQIASLFGRDKSVISRHIKNIFLDQELDKNLVSAKFAQTTTHGAIKDKTQTKEVLF